MAGGEEFDVAEFSSSEFVQRFARGQCPFVAIPVFPSRAFRHGFIAIHRQAGIRTPKDLEGKRVGVPLLTMTAVIYINGLLAHEYGVDLRKIHWVQGAMNTAGAHGSPTVLPLLDPVPIEQNRSGKSLSDLIAARAVDATWGTSLPEAIRTKADIVRLFPDYVDLEKEYYRRTRIYPIMHLVAIRKQVHESYPFVATSLYDAFCEAKKIALEKMLNLRALRYMTPWLMRDIDEIYELFDGDPWPYGVEANRPTLGGIRHLSPGSIPDRRAGCGGRSVRADVLGFAFEHAPVSRSGRCQGKPVGPPPLAGEGGRSTSHPHDPRDDAATQHEHSRQIIADLVVANRILAREDVVDAYGHVSIRHPDNPKHFFLSRSRAPELVERDDIVELDLDGEPVREEKRALYLERFIHAADPASAAGHPGRRACARRGHPAVRHRARRRRCVPSFIPAASSERTCRCGISRTDSATPISWSPTWSRAATSRDASARTTWH